jgi:hypothetical protein
MGELMHQLIDRERAADCAANEPAPLRRYQIIIGPPRVPRLSFEALAPDSMTAVTQHAGLCEQWERIEAKPIVELFMATKWTPSGELVEERHCWYASAPALRREIEAGWAQFAADLAAYTPPAAAEPIPTGRAPDTLPALRIELMGQVTASNLSEFKATALGAIRSVNRELSTDQHFADAKQAVKWCGEVESRIKAAKDHALSQTASIEELFRTLDDVSAEARAVRLDLEKLVTRREQEIKGELVAAAKLAYDQHETALRQECGAWQLLTPPDFGGAIKGKRSVDSMRDALDACLANAKITASEQARTIRAALAALADESKGFEHLFRDSLNFIMLPPDIVRQMARGRIAEHQAAEQRRAAELAEQERDRIRAEEQAKLQREQQEREAAEARQRAEAAAPSQPPAAAPIAQPDAVSQAAAVVPIRPASGPPTLKLGQINERLAPLSISAEGLARLGFPAAAKERSACLYHDADFPRMVDAAIAHLRAAQQERRAA